MIKKYIKLAKNKVIKRSAIVVLFLILANLFYFSLPALADEENTENNKGVTFDYKLIQDSVKGIMEIINPEVLSWGGDVDNKDSHLPENGELKVKYAKDIVVTAYNSEVGQCDDSPCVTANGFNVCKHGKEDTVAINGLKFGTRVRFPELFGDRVFVVRDRMNARYNSGHVDVWMISKADAKQFGVKSATMEILE
jgi:3D (Asp-Asp-Asp) domain-containing protein